MEMTEPASSTAWLVSDSERILSASVHVHRRSVCKTSCGQRKEFHVLRKERMMTVAMAGLLFGMIIRKNTPGHEHPSTMAAFSRSRGMERNCSLIFQSDIHQKYAIIDDRIVWYGSINLLSFGSSQESMMRLVSGSIAHELMKTEAFNENR